MLNIYANSIIYILILAYDNSHLILYQPYLLEPRNLVEINTTVICIYFIDICDNISIQTTV